MIDWLREVSDDESADALAIIMHDEGGNVGVTKRWFDYVCGLQRLDPSAAGTDLSASISAAR